MYYIIINLVEHLSHKKLAISNDVLAIVDGGNNK